MLARTLGMTVGQLEAAMSAQEFGEWKALYAVQPWGEFAADLRTGIVASTIANVNRSANSKVFVPDDFMPLQKQEQEQEPEAEPDPQQLIQRTLSNG